METMNDSTERMASSRLARAWGEWAFMKRLAEGWECGWRTGRAHRTRARRVPGCREHRAWGPPPGQGWNREGPGAGELPWWPARGTRPGTPAGEGSPGRAAAPCCGRP